FKTDYAGGVTGNNGTGDLVFGVQFCQAFDKLLLLRRPLQGGENLVWDGGATTDWEKTVVTAGGTLIPGSFHGEPFMDRVVFYNANAPAVATRDEWILSDVEDYSPYDAVYQVFRTNPAEADYITRIMAYYRGSVVVFKNQSIHMVELQPTFPV